MMIIITRYPASEDRLIVRPLLSRVCALRLQPAEPQPYKRDVFGCHVNLFVSTFGDRAKNGRKTGVGWAIGSNNLTSWSQLTPSLCWVGAIFVLLTALATRNGQRRLQKRPAQQNRASRMAFEDIAQPFDSASWQICPGSRDLAPF